MEKILEDLPFGFDISASINGSVAFYRGPGIADARSWVGVFYGVSGGGGPLGKAGVGGFWDPNGYWIGVSGGLGVGMPASLRTNPQTYYLKKTVGLPKCACYALILQMP